MYSLKARLLWTLLVILTLTMLCTGVATYFSLKSEVSRLLDGSMVQGRGFSQKNPLPGHYGIGKVSLFL